jgi:ubiquinone biosynthesis protein
LDRRILSEASVGGVVPFSWVAPESRTEKQGVFKVLKPNIGPCLEEELTVLDYLADYFDSRRQEYSFGRFRFRPLFEDVKTALHEELNLPGEQRNLTRAYSFYKKDRTVCIPTLAPFSSPRFTAMSFMPGAKVTDALTCEEDRKQAAHTLFRAIICAPLFSRQEHPIFHGDPHAGNIFSSGRSETGDVRVTLLDWSQCGRLAKHWRISILKFVQGVIRDDEKMICGAVSALSVDTVHESSGRRIEQTVRELTATAAYSSAPLMKKAFIMLDRLSVQGIRFPKDLLLFRKTFFTLDGLLDDLDPEFDMDQAVMTYMRGLLIRELPERIAVLLAAVDDAPERYRSLLSNKDLQMLFICHAIDIIKRNAGMAKDLMEKYVSLLTGLFRLPTFFAARLVKILLGLYYLYKLESSEV